jgi:HSP20 family protein
MRLRIISITYSFGGSSPGGSSPGGSSPSLERHYRELREAMLHPAQHYSALQPAAWRPPLDIHETDEALVVKAELAGMREDAIDIALYENALVITGQRGDDSDHAETAYYHEAQVRYGPFRAEIVLPTPIERERAEARYENGFLRVRLPKAVRAEALGDQTDVERSGPGTSAGGHQLASVAVTPIQPPISMRTPAEPVVSSAGDH